MKKSLVFILISILGVTACNNSKKAEPIFKTNNTIPFIGNWGRSFELGVDSTQLVFYRVWEDSIQYEMKGPLNLNYTLKKDTFIANDNRWLGNLHGNPYVIFVKNVTSDSIAIFKKEVKNKEEALTMLFPSDTAMSRFSPWNVYYLKE